MYFNPESVGPVPIYQLVEQQAVNYCHLLIQGPSSAFRRRGPRAWRMEGVPLAPDTPPLYPPPTVILSRGYFSEPQQVVVREHTLN
jgi:hypothetical protein